MFVLTNMGETLLQPKWKLASPKAFLKQRGSLSIARLLFYSEVSFRLQAAFTEQDPVRITKLHSNIRALFKQLGAFQTARLPLLPWNSKAPLKEQDSGSH